MQTTVRVTLSLQNIVARAVWSFVWIFLFRPSPRPFHWWRILLLKLFGARVGKNVRIYQSARIWAPWNLRLDDGSCIGDWVDCYCVAPVHLSFGAVVSQYSYLCTATHDFTRRSHSLLCAPIYIGSHAWVTARCFIGPGVTVGEGAVVGACSVVTRNVEAWTVVAGTPPRFLKRRELIDDTQ